jgi:hypothetical protein
MYNNDKNNIVTKPLRTTLRDSMLSKGCSVRHRTAPRSLPTGVSVSNHSAARLACFARSLSVRYRSYSTSLVVDRKV